MALNLSGKIRSLLAKGFFHIFGANVVNKILSFVTNIVIVWFLTKGEYGVFGYANSIYSIALLATGAGLISGMFQFCLEDRPDSEKVSIFGYALIRGLLVDCLLVVAVILVGLYVPLSIAEANRYLAMFGPLILLDYLFQYCATVLRIRFDNKRYSRLQLMNATTYSVFACAGAFLAGVTGTIMGRYVAYLVSLVLAFKYLAEASFAPSLRGQIESSTKRQLWVYSVSTQVSAALNTLTYLLDVFLVGLLLASSWEVASYKVATLIPEGMAFVPSSVITFALPYFVRHSHDRGWFLEKFRMLIGASFAVYAAIAAVLILLAPIIIEVLWGSDYADATTAFRLLAASFLFNGIRSTCTNLLCALRAVKSNLVISAISLAINVVLCFLLIPEYGINGAAFVPLSISVAAAVVALVLLLKEIPKRCELGAVQDSD